MKRTERQKTLHTKTEPTQEMDRDLEETSRLRLPLENDTITDIQVVSAPGEDSAYLSQGAGRDQHHSGCPEHGCGHHFRCNLQLHWNYQCCKRCTWKGGKSMKKRQRKIRLIRAGIQLLFFIFGTGTFFHRICRRKIHFSGDRGASERSHGTLFWM